MQAYIERFQQTRIALFEESTKKRHAPSDLIKSADSIKRARLENRLENTAVPTAVPVPVSAAQIFTIESNQPGSQNFDVTVIPHDTVVRILLHILPTIDPTKLETSVNIVKGRLLALAQAQADAANAAAAATANNFVEDEEEYEPVFEPVEDTEQIKNRLDMEDPEDLAIGIPKPSHVNLGPFHLPGPQPLSEADLNTLNTTIMDSLFNKIELTPLAPQSTSTKSGLYRVAANGSDRNALITTFSRFITRPAAGLFSKSPKAAKTQEGLDGDLSIPKVHDLNNRGRYKLLRYILSDWTRRMEMATTWLTEEWYNDQICKKAYTSEESKVASLPPEPNFPRWTLHFLDELSAYIGSEHTKLLIRFVSDVPGLDADIIEKVKRLAQDPERVAMVITVIQ
jgi:symplekin